MTYTLTGSEAGFAQLNKFRTLSGVGRSSDDVLAYYRAYEEFLFPDSPQYRTSPEEMLIRNREDDSLLGRLTTLTDEEIDSFSDLTLVDRIKSSLPLKRFSNFGSAVFNANRKGLYEVVEKMLLKVENEVMDRIGGNFAVVRVNRLVTRAGASDKSAKWHFDPVPCSFFKIFAYLNGPEAHDGATDFLDGRASSQLLQSGYHLLPAEKRASEIGELSCGPARLSQIKERGDVFLFNPALTVHRGHYPSFGRRDVFEISILKSPVNWRDSFDNIYGLAAMSGTPSYATWPRWIN